MLSFKRRVAIALAPLTLLSWAVGAVGANADPVRAFETFEVQCGSDRLVVVSKPGSSTVVTINGLPSNSVSILMGITITIGGVVVTEFHKPYTQHQDVKTCTEVDPGAGTTIVLQVLNTPPSK
jgi:hypothetical protein